MLTNKINTAVKDYKEERALNKAAADAYRGTYKREHGKAVIDRAVKKAKKDAHAAPKAGGGALASLQSGARHFSGVPAAMDAVFLGEIPKRQPQRKATTSKPKAISINTGNQRITISPTTHSKKKKQKQASTGFELYNPAIFDF